MTLVSVIIRDAYRESNLIAIAADPTADEQAEGLRLLNRLVASVYGIDAGEPLSSLGIGGNNVSRPSGYPFTEELINSGSWFVPSNVRLVLNLEEATNVYLDPNPEDGARFALIDKSGNLATHNLTIYGNGNTIGDVASVIISTNSANQEYFYRADTGNWALVSTLAEDDTFPFPERFEDLFVIGLAMRLNPRDGVAVDPQSISTYSKLLREFKATYRQTRQVPSELALRRLNSMRLIAYESINDGTEFNLGRPFYG